MSRASIPDRMGETVAGTDGRKAFDGYWPEYCELAAADDQPCEGLTVYRLREPDERSVYVCESHFGRIAAHLYPARHVDRLR